MAFDRDTSVYVAKLAEQAKRYHDGIEQMTEVAKMDENMTMVERDRLYTGYWNEVVLRKNYIQQLTDIGREYALEGNHENFARITQYKLTFVDDITKLCNAALSLLENDLIPSATDADAFVFCYKMKGDFVTYKAEHKSRIERDEDTFEALKAYEKALSKAETLTHAHPYRLGLALKLSLLYVKMLDSPRKACEVAQNAVEGATRAGGLDNNKSMSILRVLEKNIKKWSGTDDEDSDDRLVDINA